MFISREVLPGVYHIRDPLGVYMTLLKGEARALLIDTGYGVESAAALVRTITDKPVTVLLTHAHHDHALGARDFDSLLLAAPEIPLYPDYTSPERRARVAQQAAGAGVTPPADYLTAAYPVPQPAQAEELDLGGMTARIIPCPGHTPGSAVVYVPERRLLLSGDNWNPCTWLFFPEAAAVQDLIGNMRAALALPFDHVLCSHREALYPRAAIDAFYQGLTRETLEGARRVDMGHPIATREAVPAEGQVFVFDYDKYAARRREEEI